jgi:serine/threonine protein kinase
MGIVYRAYDSVMRREVAIKTLRDAPSQMVLDLFYRECGVLAGMVHPNIVEIFDMGEYDDEGTSRPFFVMPLLPGRTLYDLIYPSREPVTVERCVEICAQTCRGLQAAHDRGLLHRDIKPKNIFVIDDYSIKIIDFGVAHLLDSQSATGIKGTLEYMAPEQLGMKPLSPSTDVFAVGTVCYEMLTATQPFKRATDADTAAAVIHHHPPVASDLSPRVPRLFAQVISKAMAKDARSRFSSAAEFAEALQKAFRNEPLKIFDPAGARVRLERARRCFDHSDLTFASDILRELEAEGQFPGEVRSLREQVQQALNTESANQLLTEAKRCFEEEEYSLALRKIHEVLDLDEKHEGAHSLKQQIENILTEHKVDELLQTAGHHLENVAFTSARQALNEVLKLRPDDTRARGLLAEVDERHKQYLRNRQEQEKLYQVSRAAWIDGDISLALENLERLAELCRSSRESRERVVEYKDFYKLVRTEHDALINSFEEAQRLLAEDDLTGALSLADYYLGKHPAHAGFGELKRQVEERFRQKRIAFIESAEARAAAEPDLDLRISILDEAFQQYPDESRLAERLEAVRRQRTEVANIVERAQNCEEAGDHANALREWESLRSVHPEYPGLAAQIERVKEAREQAREAAKAHVLARANQLLAAGDPKGASNFLRALQADFRGDPAVADLETRIDNEFERHAKSDTLLAEGRRFAGEGRFAEAQRALASAFEVGRGRPGFGTAVLDSLAAAARGAVDSDWRSAEELVRALSSLDSSYRVSSQLTRDIETRKRDEAIERAVFEAREMQSSGDLKGALERTQAALQTYSEDTRLVNLNAELLEIIERERKRRQREEDLAQLRALREECDRTDVEHIRSRVPQARAIFERHKDDAEFLSIRDRLEAQLRGLEQVSDLLQKDQTREALALCDEHLQRYPEHAAFTALRRQSEDREREIAAAYIGDAERRLAAEPRIEQRLAILQEALSHYPSEPYFHQELALVREEDKLIQSIVSKARSQEKAQNYSEAIEHWKSLRTIYKHYAGLEDEIARVAAAFEKERAAKKAGYLQQIGNAVNAGSYPRAWELIRSAEAEFPRDSDFDRLAAQVKQAEERRSKVQKLMAEAQELSGAHQYAAAGEKLEAAFQTADGESILRKQVLDAFLKYSRSALKSDWAAAGALLERAARLDTGFRPPADLKSAIEQHKREHEVQQCLTQAQKFESSGDAVSALQKVNEGLASFSNEPRLLERKKTLTAAIEQARREAEQRKLREELREFEQTSRGANDSRALRGLVDRVSRIRDHPEASGEIRSAALALLAELEAVERAREFIAKEQFAEALAICNAHLSKHPEHAAFSALKRDAEDRERLRASAFLSDVERRLAGQPRIEQRVGILEDALKRYPDELYFQQELALAREEQKLIQSVVQKARVYEENQNYADAVEHWKSLRTMYKHYPGLEDEITRNSRLLEQARAAKKAKLAEQIASAIKTGGYARARDLLRSGDAEFPRDEELAALRAKMQRAEEGRAQAQKLISDAQDLCNSQRFADAGAALSKAFQAAEEHPGLRNQVLDAYVKHARTAVKTDWQAAKSLIEQAVQLDPGYRIPEELAARIEQRRREHRIQEIFTETQTLETSGNVAGALSKVAAGLEEFPQEPRLLERHKALTSVLEQARRNEERRKQRETLLEIQQESRTIADPKLLDVLRQRATRLAREGGESGEIARGIADIQAQLDAIARSRDLLAKDQTAQVIAICSEYLAKYPQHAAFTAIKREAEDRERQRAASYLAEVERRLSRKPRFEERIQILQEALARYPDEGYYQRELALVREEEKLIGAAAEKAKSLEKAGNYQDALEQWKNVRTMYKHFPAVDSEIERVTRLRADARQAEERRAKCEKLAAEAQDLFANRKYAQASDKLRAAFEAGSRDSSLQQHVLEHFVRHARALLNTDWTVAEALVKQAMKLERAFVVPEDLSAGIEQRRQEYSLAAREKARAAEAAAQTVVEPQETVIDVGVNGGVGRAKTPVAETVISPPVAPEKPSVTEPEPGGLGAVLARVPKSWLYAGAALVTVLALTWLPRISFRSTSDFVVTSSPADVSVEIAGKKCLTPNCRLALKPGTYELKAEKDGYRSISRDVIIVSGRDAQSLELTLQPLTTAIQIMTNLEFGLVTLDGKSAGSLRDGQLVLDGTGGNHAIGITSGDVTGTVRYVSRVGEAPRVPEPLQVANAQGVVITALNGNGMLFCNCGEQPVTLDGKDVGRTRPSGVPLSGLTPGSHELKIGTGQSARSYIVGIVQGPAVNFLISAARGSGTLVVDAGQDNVSVFVNGTQTPRQTSRGLLRIPLDTGEYSIRVEKPGFNSPPPQHVAIGREEKRVVFRLQPKPAVLQIAGMPRVTLSIDGRVVGTTGEDGSFSAEVPPGAHVLEFMKDRRNERLQRVFAPGDTVRFTASDMNQLRHETARQQWEQAKTIADFERYRQMHPNGQHFDEALVRMSQLEWDLTDKKNRSTVQAFARRYASTPLGQQAQQIANELGRQEDAASLERKVETEWAALDKRNKGALQTFIKTYPFSPRVQQAQQMIGDLTRAEEATAAGEAARRAEQTAWDSADKKDRAALQAYLTKFPSGAHANDARRMLQSLSEGLPPADRKAILETLTRYQGAFNSKNVDAVLAQFPKLNRGQLRSQFSRTVTNLQIQPSGEPTLSGPRIVLPCKRTTTTTFRNNEQAPSTVNANVRVIFTKNAGGWIIESIEE